MQWRSPVSRSKAGGLEIALFGKQFRELRSNFPGVLCDSDFRFKEPTDSTRFRAATAWQADHANERWNDECPPNAEAT